MKKAYLLITLAFLLFACKDKKKGNGADGIIEMSDFIELFPKKKVPFLLGDSTVKKAARDSGAITFEVFTRFVPDSVIYKDFGKKAKPVFYPLCRIESDDSETYLYAKAAKDNKRVAYLVVLDEKQVYSTGRAMMVTTTDAGVSQNTGLDSKYTITSTLQYRTAKGQTIYKKNAYVYNKDAADLTLILTESNDASASKSMELLNPLDTFPKKKKYSGDYIQDKMNIISIRDGNKDKEILFFVHVEKENGECKGELKATATIVSPESAVYSEPGNPCVLRFVFKGNTVSLKEEKGCGNFRDIKCFFEGSFVKKKEPKPLKEAKPVKKKS
jgi:hypothetical protein